ncbi:MAG: pentapeptide repeat-containing protein [Nitrospira sp. SB0662_bin_26]|nr:pentapeptide repeat-containing protein [Nitrospira sp. SB0662_bin_26]
MRPFWIKIKASAAKFIRMLNTKQERTGWFGWFLVMSWVLIVLLVAYCLATTYWDWLSVGEANGKTIRKSGSEIVRNLGLVIAAIIALPLAIWRSIVAERQAIASQRQAETAQRSLLNERYQKGAEMLGSDILPVRLGGIYALAHLAHEHPEEYHIQIMQLLCAFVRTPPEENEKSEAADRDQQAIRIREDIQAILTAIGKRSEAQIHVEKRRESRLNLSHVNLVGAKLSDTNLFWAKLEYAKLSDVLLDGANLQYVDLFRTDLFRATLIGVNLHKAFLEDTNLTSAHLAHCKGLTQRQLDKAVASKNDPPRLTKVVDAESGAPLVWRGDHLHHPRV